MTLRLLHIVLSLRRISGHFNKRSYIDENYIARSVGEPEKYPRLTLVNVSVVIKSAKCATVGILCCPYDGLGP